MANLYLKFASLEKNVQVLNFKKEYALEKFTNKKLLQNSKRNKEFYESLIEALNDEISEAEWRANFWSFSVAAFFVILPVMFGIESAKTSILYTILYLVFVVGISAFVANYFGKQALWGLRELRKELVKSHFNQ